MDFSIVQFLNRDLAFDHTSEDAKEGLKLASQCLQTVYCINPEDTHLEVSRPLLNMFMDPTKNEPPNKKPQATADEKEEAERL